jgi:hypothetical protein
MTRTEMQAMMAFLMDGDFWPRPPEDCLCKRTHSHGRAMELRCKRYGDLNGDKKDCHTDKFEDDEAGTPESPELRHPAFLDCKTSNRPCPSHEWTSLSYNTESWPENALHVRAKHTEGPNPPLLCLPSFRQNVSPLKNTSGGMHAAEMLENGETQTVRPSPDAGMACCEGACGFPRDFRRQKKQENSLFDLDPEQQTRLPEEFPASLPPAAPAVRLKNPRLTISTGLESGVPQDFMKDVKEALAYVLQKELERGTDFLMVVAVLNRLLILMINDVRKQQQGFASGVAQCAPTLTHLDTEGNGFFPVYDIFRRQFDKAFESALEQEQHFKKSFPGALTSLRTQVVEILRRLRKAVQSIPDQVARHTVLMASIRSHGRGLQRAHGARGSLLSIAGERYGEGGEAKGSLRLKTSSRHCQWCSWKVHTSPEQECEICAYWTVPNPRGRCGGCHSNS